MIEALAEVYAEDIVIRNRGSISLNIQKIQCDYYSFIKNDGELIREWAGEFMTQYSWAEPVAGYISREFEKSV